MSSQVKVEDLEVFRLFRVALLKFAHAAGQSMANADNEISRTRSWLDTEQTTFWQGQLRKRAEAVTKAREAVRQKKLYKDPAGRTPGAVEEEKYLAQCLVAFEQAQHKIEAIRKWLPRLEKEADLYRGGVVRLGEAVSVNVPKAVALLDRLAATLEQYIQIEAGAMGGGVAAAEDTAESGMARGGEGPEHAVGETPAPVAAPSIQPSNASAAAAAPDNASSLVPEAGSSTAEVKEADHVPHG